MDRIEGKLCVVFLTAFLLLSGCGRRTAGEGSRSRSRDNAAPIETNEGRNVAYVRFVNAHSGGGFTALYFGATKVIGEAEYKSVSHFTKLPAERRTFILRDEGKPEGEPLTTSDEALTAGKYYGVFAFDNQDDVPTISVVSEDEGEPSPRKAKIRLLHAAPGVPSIEVYASGRTEKLAGESRFGHFSAWREIDPVDTALDIRTSAEALMRVPNMGLDGGRLYTLIVVGGGKANRKLDLIRITDSGRNTKR